MPNTSAAPPAAQTATPDSWLGRALARRQAEEAGGEGGNRGARFNSCI